MSADLTALYDENATLEEHVRAMQYMIDTGQVWSMEGSMGRSAMSLIESGHCILGTEAHRDYWGNRVPSRDEVKPDTEGSVEYALRVCPEGPHGWT